MMADADEETGHLSVCKALEKCKMVQGMIDISAEHLEGLRTQCATSAEITQQEIRTLEGKLITYFSLQLLVKAQVRKEENQSELEAFPRLQQWLRIVGLGTDRIERVFKQIKSLEALLKMPEREVSQMLEEYDAKEDERLLIRALYNLRKYIDCQLQGKKMNSVADLHWDSWDRASSSSSSSSMSLPSGINTAGSSAPNMSPRLIHVPLNAPWSSVPHEDKQQNSHLPCTTSSRTLAQPPPWSPGPTTNSVSTSLSSSCGGYFTADRRYTPPSTPPTVYKKSENVKKFPTTPPPRKKQVVNTTTLLPDAPPLTKSWSHESQLSNRVDQSENSNGFSLRNLTNTLIGHHSCEQLPRRQRLHTEPGPESDQEEVLCLPGNISPVFSSPSRSVPEQNTDLITDDTNNRSQPIPPSPRLWTTGGVMIHDIKHRFNKTFKVTTCDFCSKQMFLGYKCKECKFKCHRDCVDKVPPSCRLPSGYLEEFVRSVKEEGGSRSPGPTRTPILSPPLKDGGINCSRRPHLNQPVPAFLGPDSSSNDSSCNSSTPSSPALVTTHTPPIIHKHHFDFPEVVLDKGITLNARPLKETCEMVETQKSNDSDKTVSGTSGSTDSEKTLAGRVDSQDSQISDVDCADRSWPRQNSLSFREWEIPYNELIFGEAVGKGRFGTVYRGNWHGDVAIKVFNMDHVDDEKILDVFKQEVATFRKTRHENLVLFMGACMNSTHPAIVTRLCKGLTLYTHIHVHHDRFQLSKAVIIAQQISQGMGYIHARGIVHKDLKSKNIFLENGKVVITDFGLFSVTKLCHGNRKGEWLTIPPGWLCYLAPEIVCILRASHTNENDNLPFTAASDIFSFGTVWYELLCGEWPFKGQPPEAIIWQVGRGVKQSLAHIQASRDVKDILMACWAYHAKDRPDFSCIVKLLEKLPKKRLARSPSHPVQLSRSAESVF